MLAERVHKEEKIGHMKPVKNLYDLHYQESLFTLTVLIALFLGHLIWR